MKETERAMNDDTAVYIEHTPPHAHPKEPPPGIEGWGADLDPANRPAVPKERTPPRLDPAPETSPVVQRNPNGITVFHSTERPGLTPVFGTSVPPSGVSGLLRRLAFRYSENDLRHWTILLLADRINEGEGILEDLAHGHVPNFFKEMGGPAEWRCNRAGFIRKAVITGTLIAVAVYLLRHRRSRT
jgi:hypothetical protein